MESKDQSIEKALRQNEFIHRYLMAIDHALLWVSALNIAAFVVTMRNRRIIRNNSEYKKTEK